MAARKPSSSPDFESRVFDLLIDRLDKQDEDRKEDRKLLEKVHSQVQYTNGKVKTLRSDVDELKTKAIDLPAKKDLPAFFRDPKVIQILLYLSLAILIAVAYVAKFDIGGLIR